jgi:putative oxidoreductase
MGFLKPYGEHVYGIMRIVVGFLFLCHGLGKILGVLGGSAAALPSLMWFAGIIELVGGAMVCVGLFTGWAAFICSGQMAVAYFMAHQPNALFPIQNKGELAALYSWVFLFIAIRGSGMFSLDSFLGDGSDA